MNRGLPARRAGSDLPAPRIRGALATARDLVLPGAGATALYLLVPGQWQAFKAILAAWGVSPAWGVVLTPVVLGGAIMAVRWAVRTFRGVDASPDP